MLEWEQPPLGDLLTTYASCLRNGMILQVSLVAFPVLRHRNFHLSAVLTLLKVVLCSSRSGSVPFSILSMRLSLNAFEANGTAKPIGTMYGILTYIYHIFRPNVGKYSIHGAYGKQAFKDLTRSHESPGLVHESFLFVGRNTKVGPPSSRSWVKWRGVKGPL